VIALGDVRKAITAALRDVGLNESTGADAVPPAFLVGTFNTRYHATIAGSPVGMAVAALDVIVIVARADEPSAMEAVDETQSTVWQYIEAIAGPWHTVRVTGSEMRGDITVGESRYIGVAFAMEFYV
jgi:hypothetical protein